MQDLTQYSSKTVRAKDSPGRPPTLGILFALALGACGSDEVGDPAVNSRQTLAVGEVTTMSNPSALRSGEPNLASEDGGVWLSWIDESVGGHKVTRAYYDGSWGEPQVIAEGEDFFVNWADFPSVLPMGDTAVAHWLQRASDGTYDYGVRLSWTTDGGVTWTPGWTPHLDGTPTEHGFVSLYRDANGVVGAAWLDGRAMVEGGPMGLRSREIPVGRTVPENVSEAYLVDDRTCECCQTDITVASGGPVLAYRDRGEDDLRNIYVARRTDAGWTEGVPVHDDGWVVGGCPVNGPALASRGNAVAIAWFTAPEEAPRVNVAFSADGGATFSPPTRVDLGQPSGRVDVEMLEDGSAIVSWLERGQSSGEGAVVLRRVRNDGVTGPAKTVSGASEERSSGFPRIAPFGDGHLLVAWTDPSEDGGVRTATVSIAPTP